MKLSGLETLPGMQVIGTKKLQCNNSGRSVISFKKAKFQTSVSNKSDWMNIL